MLNSLSIWSAIAKNKLPEPHIILKRHVFATEIYLHFWQNCFPPWMEIKKQSLNSLERAIHWESDAPGMSAPAATELPASSSCSKRSSDIPLGKVDLPSLHTTSCSAQQLRARARGRGRATHLIYSSPFISPSCCPSPKLVCAPKKGPIWT